MKFHTIESIKIYSKMFLHCLVFAMIIKLVTLIKFI